LVVTTNTGPKAIGSSKASSGARSALAGMLLIVKKLASISIAVRQPPSGNKASTEQLPGAAPLAQMWRNARLADRLEIASAKVDIACLQRALFVAVAGPGLAGKRRH
jgi:hypothetical protein